MANRYGFTRSGAAYSTSASVETRSGRMKIYNTIPWSNQRSSESLRATINGVNAFAALRDRLPSIYSNAVDPTEAKDNLKSEGDRVVYGKLNNTIQTILDELNLENPYSSWRDVMSDAKGKTFAEFNLSLRERLSEATDRPVDDFHFGSKRMNRLRHMFEARSNEDREISQSIGSWNGMKGLMGQFPIRIGVRNVWHVLISIPMLDPNDIATLDDVVKKILDDTEDVGKDSNRTFKFISFKGYFYKRPTLRINVAKLFEVQASWMSRTYKNQIDFVNWIKSITNFYERHGDNIEKDDFMSAFKSEIAYDPTTYASAANMFDMLDRLYRAANDNHSYIFVIDVTCEAHKSGKPR